MFTRTFYILAAIVCTPLLLGAGYVVGVRDHNRALADAKATIRAMDNLSLREHRQVIAAEHNMPLPSAQPEAGR